MEQGLQPFFCGLDNRESFFSLFYEQDGFLQELEKSARARKVPIIRREMVQFMELLLGMAKPLKILEVGTAIGYSALMMSRFLKEQGKLITIERNPVMWQEALQRIEEAKKYKAEHPESNLEPDKIEVKIGDAAEILPSLTDGFDIIFLDSAKAQYINFLPELLRLLNPGGMLITDNVLQNGEIIASKHLLVRRERTTHRRMRQYLWAISKEETLETKYFGLADGVTVSIKKEINRPVEQKRRK